MAKGESKPDENEEIEQTEESQEETENQEETEEVKVIEVKKPIEIENMTKEDRESLIKDIKQQEIKEHLEAEAKRIEAITCPGCGKPLGLKPEDYIKQGNKPQQVECKKCQRLVRVFVNYKGDPEVSRAKISVKSRGYAWATQPPATWKDKHTIEWVKEEKERLEGNISSLSSEGQILFRIQLLILKKQKVIK